MTTALIYSTIDKTAINLWEIGIIWFYGAIAATMHASFLGLIVEFPKSYIPIRKDRLGIVWQLLISIAGALILLITWTVVKSDNKIAMRDNDWYFLIFSFLIGGGCSGVFWWHLVILPLRTSETISK